MRIECPKCGHCADEDDFEEHDELAEALEDAREEVRHIQFALMGNYRHPGRSIADIAAHIEREARLSRGSIRPAAPEDFSFDLREADHALRAGRVGDAIYHLEKFSHPSKAATAALLEAAE